MLEIIRYDEYDYHFWHWLVVVVTLQYPAFAICMAGLQTPDETCRCRRHMPLRG
ncbi:hypothetical protein ACLB1Q_21060 [Escherichia coli]